MAQTDHGRMMFPLGRKRGRRTEMKLETGEHRDCASVSWVKWWICRGCRWEKLPGRMLLPERQGQGTMTALESPIIFFGTAPPFGDSLHPAAAGPLKGSTTGPNRPGPRKRLQGPLSTSLGKRDNLWGDIPFKRMINKGAKEENMWWGQECFQTKGHLCAGYTHRASCC